VTALISAEGNPDRLFDGTTRRAVALVLAIGLASIFVPIFSIDHAVMGRADWSALDILASVAARHIAPDAALFNATMMCLWLSYLSLLLGMIALWLPHYEKPLALAGFIGLYASDRVIVHGHYDFRLLLSAKSLGGPEELIVSYQPTVYGLPILFVLLLLLVQSKFRRS